MATIISYIQCCSEKLNNFYATLLKNPRSNVVTEKQCPVPRNYVSKYMAYTYTRSSRHTWEHVRKTVKRVSARICICIKQSWLFSPYNFPTLSMLCFCDASRHARAWPLSAISLGQSINLSIGQIACKISTWGKQN